MRLLLLFAILFLAGCGTSKRDELTAALAASSFEAAEAIKKGVSPAKPAAAIQAASAAIIYAMGYDYPPAAEYLKQLAAPQKANAP